ARHGDALAPAVLGPTLAVGGLALLSGRRWSLPVAAGALAWSTASVRRVLPEAPGRTGLALHLAARGLSWSVRQEAALATRHWWPAALLGALSSRRIRRVVTASLLVDSAIALANRKSDGLDVPTAIAGRRLDDLAYGTGLWWGAWRARSVRVLLPRKSNSPSGRMQPGQPN
ncbi:MAG TPA: mycofactocin system glycosyltransferase, partial [Nocardioides sp.]